MNKLLGEPAIHPHSLAQMRERGGTWAAYQNHAMDSTNLGHLQFLQYGEGRTFPTPPERYPDTAHGLGWRYLHVGFVNLTTGQIADTEPLK